MIPQYVIYRSDRCDGRKGGGVCVYVDVRTRIDDVVTHAIKPSCIEAVWLRLVDANIILAAVYIPPNLLSNVYNTIEDYLVDCFDDATNLHPDSFLMITGDMNQFPTKHIENQLNLTQIVDSPTRRNSTLDKIFLDSRLLHCYSSSSSPQNNSSQLGRFPFVNVHPSVGNSDHHSVFMRSFMHSVHSSRIVKVYDYRTSHLVNFKLKLASFP